MLNEGGVSEGNDWVNQTGHTWGDSRGRCDTDSETGRRRQPGIKCTKSTSTGYVKVHRERTRRVGPLVVTRR